MWNSVGEAFDSHHNDYQSYLEILRKEPGWRETLRRNFFRMEVWLMSLRRPANLYLELASSFPLWKIDLLNLQNFRTSSTFVPLHDRPFHRLFISAGEIFEILTNNNIQDGELHLQSQKRQSMKVEIRPVYSSRDNFPHSHLRKWHPKTCADHWIPS